MKEHPILFSAPMVNAIRGGFKKQTRRIIKGIVDYDYEPASEIQESYDVQMYEVMKEKGHWFFLPPCEYQKGETLWIRENYRFGKGYDGVKPSEVPKQPHVKIFYEADAGIIEPKIPDGFGTLRPSIFLPRYFSRATLKVSETKAERLHDISENDAIAEGGIYHDGGGVGHSGWRHDINHGFVYPTARESFFALWAAINGKESLDSNPWVYAISFDIKELK